MYKNALYTYTKTTKEKKQERINLEISTIRSPNSNSTLFKN